MKLEYGNVNTLQIGASGGGGKVGREFNSELVEELIKQAFRLRPEGFFLKNEAMKADIENAIDFVREAAELKVYCRNVSEVQDKYTALSGGLYSHLLGVVVAETIQHFPNTPVSEIIIRARSELGKAGIKP